MTIINPRGFEDDFPGWADRMSFLIDLDAPQFQINLPGVADDWRGWALCIVGSQDRLGQDSPNPYHFDNWVDWAEQLFITQDFSG